MQIHFLETAQPGLIWFRRYYEDRPDLNWEMALQAYRAALATLQDNPRSGTKFDERQDVFERKIIRTQFSFLYTIQDEQIFIIDVRDQRGWRSAQALRGYIAELKQKYGLE